MNPDLYLELTWQEICQSQANRDADRPDLSKYDRLADKARDRSQDR